MKKISTILAITLCAILILGLLSVLKGMLIPGKSKEQDTRLHLNTGNTTRVYAKSPDELSLQTANILHPSYDQESRPDGYVLVKSNHWQDIMTLIPIANKYNCPILYIPDKITSYLTDYIRKKAPKGIKKMEGIQLLVFENGSNTLDSELQKLNNMKTSVNPYKNTNSLMSLVNELTEDGNNFGFVVM